MTGRAAPTAMLVEMAPVTIRAWNTLFGELRLTVSPVAAEDVGRWHALLARLPAVRSISREDADGRTVTFSLGDAHMTAVLMQLKRVAVFDGNESGYAATGEVVIRLRGVNLPAPAQRPAPRSAATTPAARPTPPAHIPAATPVPPSMPPAPPPDPASVAHDIAARISESKPPALPARDAGSLRRAFPRLRPMPLGPSSPPR